MSALLHGTFAERPWTSKRCWQQSTPTLSCNCCICAKNYQKNDKCYFFMHIICIGIFIYVLYTWIIYIYIHIFYIICIYIYINNISRSSHRQTPSRVPPGVSRWGNDCPEADPWNEKIRWRGSPTSGVNHHNMTISYSNILEVSH